MRIWLTGSRLTMNSLGYKALCYVLVIPKGSKMMLELQQHNCGGIHLSYIPFYSTTQCNAANQFLPQYLFSLVLRSNYNSNKFPQIPPSFLPLTLVYYLVLQGYVSGSIQKSGFKQPSSNSLDKYLCRIPTTDSFPCQCGGSPSSKHFLKLLLIVIAYTK